MPLGEHPASVARPSAPAGPDRPVLAPGGPAPQAEALTFLIVDDHPLFREALSSAIALAFPHARLVEADSIVSACAVLDAHRGIDLTLLDLSMRGVTGFEGLVMIRARFPRVPILIVSGHEDPRVVHDAVQHGASGFVPKATDKRTLMRAIADVLSGALSLPAGPDAIPSCRQARKAPLSERIARLTPQQLRVLMLIREGKLNKQIAYELDVGSSTVKAHVSEILRKLEVISRTQIVIDTADLAFQPEASYAAARVAGRHDRAEPN